LAFIMEALEKREEQTGTLSDIDSVDGEKHIMI
jgi:hypothetical protein